MFFLALHYYTYCLILNASLNVLFEHFYPKIVEIFLMFVYRNSLAIFLVFIWLLLKLICWEFLSKSLVYTEGIFSIISRTIFRDPLTTLLVVASVNIFYVGYNIKVSSDYTDNV